MRGPASLAVLAALVTAGCGGAQPVKHRRSGQTLLAAAAPVKAASAAPPAQALVTDETQNRLLLVDLPSGHIAREQTLPPDPEDIATDPYGGLVIVVSSRAGKVTVLARDTLRPLKTFGGFDEPHIVAISPDGQHAYVSDDALGTVTAIRLSDLRITGTVRVGAGAHHMTFSPDQQRVWVALGESATRVAILDTSDVEHPRLIGYFTPGFPVHDLSFSPDGRQVWLTSAGGRDVTSVDSGNRKALFRVAVGAPPQHISFAGRFAYLTSGYGAAIERADATTGRVVARVSSPYGSFELAAADGFVVTSSLLRGTLAIYRSDLEPIRVVKLAPATREVAISRP